MLVVAIVCGIWVTVMLCLLCAVHNDIIVVWVLRAINAPAFPEARIVAGSLYNEPDRWQGDLYGLKHARIGTIKYPTSIHILKVELDSRTTWEPNWIERRIVYDAVRWQQKRAIRNALMRTTNV